MMGPVLLGLEGAFCPWWLWNYSSPQVRLRVSDPSVLFLREFSRNYWVLEKMLRF
jgi:hypothetical protein